MVEMKEMVYGEFKEPEILYLEDNGKYGIAVTNMCGRYPCAYLKFPALENVMKKFNESGFYNG